MFKELEYLCRVSLGPYKYYLYKKFSIICIMRKTRKELTKKIQKIIHKKTI